MAYNHNIKDAVRDLRTKGKTYSEIKQKLNLRISKSTLSNWCEAVVLPKSYSKKLAKLKQNNLLMAQEAARASIKVKQDRLISDIVLRNEKYVKNIKDKNILKIILSMLYLGEGAKWKSHRGLMLGSSEPIIIKLYIKLLYVCYGIGIDKLRCRVSYRADQNINSLQRYWSKITLIPLKNFYKTIPDPRTIGKPTKKKEYKGVCVLTCGGTEIQLELQEIPKLLIMGL